MGKLYSDDISAFIGDDLHNILNSDQFANAPVARAFLEFVVTEAVNGRSDRLKAYTIAVEGFGRKPDFDPSSDTIVRTTAGRVRKALQAYYQACQPPPRVVITLPRGGYSPSFDIRENLPPSESVASEPISGEFSVSKPAERTGGIPGSSPPKRVLELLVGRSSLVIACALAVIAVGILAALKWETKARQLPENIVIHVNPVEYVGAQAQSLAREVDIRLAPALSRIKLAEIIPPAASAHTHATAPITKNGPENSVFFDLAASITNDAAHELIWSLTDIASNHILGSGKEPLPDLQAATVNEAVDKIAFQILGTGGAVSSSFERSRGEVLSRPTCLFRAQIDEVIGSDVAYPSVRDCLLRTVAASPNDAPAWAILSNLYTIRSFYYLGGNQQARANLLEDAERAATKAVELAPQDYLTKIALMRLSLRQVRIEDFDAFQRELRKNHSGDIYTKIAIAMRLAKLGHGKRALEILEQAQNDFGINLKNWSAAATIAYFAASDYEKSYRQMLKTTSDLRFGLALKAAVLGKLNKIDDAVPIIKKLVETSPDIRESFCSWLIDIGWAEPLVLDIADGLAKAGLVVNTGVLSVVR